MKMLRSLAAASLALVLAVSAHAQGGMSLGWGQKPNPPQSGTNPQGTLKVAIVGGVASLDSSGVPFQFDASGNLKQIDTDRDRDFPVLTSMFSSVVLNQATTYQMGTAIYVGQYTHGALMFRYAFTAADSDSARFAIRVWGKTSIGSGTLHLWTPYAGTVSSNDTCFTNGRVAADSTGTGRCMQPISFFVSRYMNTQLPALANVSSNLSNLYEAPAVAGSVRMRIRKVPPLVWRPMGVQGTMLELSDASGKACPFPYILLEVINVSNSTNATSVSCDFWPRVN